MPVKFLHTSLRFWFFLSYLITTVITIARFLVAKKGYKQDTPVSCEMRK